MSLWGGSDLTSASFFAVVIQRYEPEVQGPGGFLGNDVIIRCNVPAFVKEHVTVTSWLQEPSFNIYPSTVSGEYTPLSICVMLFAESSNVFGEEKLATFGTYPFVRGSLKQYQDCI